MRCMNFFFFYMQHKICTQLICTYLLVFDREKKNLQIPKYVYPSSYDLKKNKIPNGCVANEMISRRCISTRPELSAPRERERPPGKLARGKQLSNQPSIRTTTTSKDNSVSRMIIRRWYHTIQWWINLLINIKYSSCGRRDR